MVHRLPVSTPCRCSARTVIRADFASVSCPTVCDTSLREQSLILRFAPILLSSVILSSRALYLSVHPFQGFCNFSQLQAHVRVEFSASICPSIPRLLQLHLVTGACAGRALCNYRTSRVRTCEFIGYSGFRSTPCFGHSGFRSSFILTMSQCNSPTAAPIGFVLLLALGILGFVPASYSPF